MEGPFPGKNTEDTVEKELEYCKELIDAIKKNEKICGYPKLQEKLNLLEETVRDDIERIETSKTDKKNIEAAKDGGHELIARLNSIVTQGNLIIYLGGYHNGVRRALLKKIYEKLPGIPYYHFGDIDAGGFAILKDLRVKTGIPFQQYHMDMDTLKQYGQYGKPLTDSDRVRLEEIKKDEEFRETVAYMLEHNMKLEQECVGIG